MPSSATCPTSSTTARSATAQGHRRVLLHQHDGDAAGVDLADDLGDALDDLRRKPQRGLVEQQHLRRGHQRPADGQHLLLAARQQARTLGRPFAQDRKQLVDPRARLLARPLVRRSQPTGAKVLLHREIAEDPAALGDLDQAAARDRGGIVTRQARVPRNSIVPDVIAPFWSASVPERVRRSVLFPAPLLPSTATTARSGTERETPRRAWTAPA